MKGLVKFVTVFILTLVLVGCGYESDQTFDTTYDEGTYNNPYHLEEGYTKYITTQTLHFSGDLENCSVIVSYSTYFSEVILTSDNYVLDPIVGLTTYIFEDLEYGDYRMLLIPDGNTTFGLTINCEEYYY